jgi:hypothetical protein
MSMEELVRTVVIVWDEFETNGKRFFIDDRRNCINIRREQSPLTGKEETTGWLAGATTVIGVAWRTWPAWLRKVTGFGPSLATWTS